MAQGPGPVDLAFGTGEAFFSLDAGVDGSLRSQGTE